MSTPVPDLLRSGGVGARAGLTGIDAAKRKKVLDMDVRDCGRLLPTRQMHKRSCYAWSRLMVPCRPR